MYLVFVSSTLLWYLCSFFLFFLGCFFVVAVVRAACVFLCPLSPYSTLTFFFPFMAENKTGGTLSQDSIVTIDSGRTSKQGAEFTPHVLSDSIGEYLDVTCGTTEGRLYLGPLKDYNGSQLGSVKCIAFKGSRITPGTFEQKAIHEKVEEFNLPQR